MMPDWETVKNVFLNRWLLAAVWWAGSLLWLARDAWGIRLPLQFAAGGQSQADWLVTVTLVAFAASAARTCEYLTARRKTTRAIKARQQQVRKYLETLSFDERKVVINAMVCGSRTVYARLADPAVSALVNNGVLSPPRGQVNIMQAPFTIRAFIWEYICGEGYFLFAEEVDRWTE